MQVFPLISQEVGHSDLVLVYSGQGFLLMSYNGKNVGHSDLVMVCDNQWCTYYHSKFGDPASKSIKDIF